MSKAHLKVTRQASRHQTMSDFDFNHQSACGYIRDNATKNIEKVNCFYCLRTEQAKQLTKPN